MAIKYKLIVEDPELTAQLKKLNKAEVARRLGVSKTYLYEAIKGKMAITEDLYLRLRAVAKEILT